MIARRSEFSVDHGPSNPGATCLCPHIHEMTEFSLKTFALCYHCFPKVVTTVTIAATDTSDESVEDELTSTLELSTKSALTVG